jgi:cytochrome bd-type quinol oxidase subunit 2
MILLGILLIAAYSSIVNDDKTTNFGPLTTAGRALQGLYTIGVVFLTAGIVLAATKTEHDDDHAMTAAAILLVLLGIALVVVSSILAAETSGSAKSWAVSLICLGLVFIGVVAGKLLYKHKGGHLFSFCSV